MGNGEIGVILLCLSKISHKVGTFDSPDNDTGSACPQARRRAPEAPWWSPKSSRIAPCSAGRRHRTTAATKSREQFAHVQCVGEGIYRLSTHLTSHTRTMVTMCRGWHPHTDIKLTQSPTHTMVTVCRGGHLHTDTHSLNLPHTHSGYSV